MPAVKLKTRYAENITKRGYDDDKSQPHRGPDEGARVLAKNDIHPSTSCSTCHR